jgi:hypothetical protein
MHGLDRRFQAASMLSERVLANLWIFCEAVLCFVLRYLHERLPGVPVSGISRRLGQERASSR